MKVRRRWATCLLALCLAASVAGCEVEESGSGSDAAQPSQDGGGNEQKPCRSRATEDCTPKRSQGQTVRVDALTWRVLSARTTKSLGDDTYGLGETAGGVFLIVKLRVRSNRDESATLSDDVIKLRASNGNTYDPDIDGTTAVMLNEDQSGGEPFFLETIGPDSSTSGVVVFDVPRSVLQRGTPMLRFGELGFGETHGFIRLTEIS